MAGGQFLNERHPVVLTAEKRGRRFYPAYTLIIIIIMEICKAPTQRLKALNKHNITHIMYIEMENLSAIKMYIREKAKANT